MEFLAFTLGSVLLFVVGIVFFELKLTADARKIHITAHSDKHFRWVATDQNNHSSFASKPVPDAIQYRWYTHKGDEGQRILGWRQHVLGRALAMHLKR